METIAKTMLAEGKACGPTEGMMVNESEGLAGGESEDKAETLKRLLNRGFGPPAPQAPTTDHCREMEQTETWLNTVNDAPDLQAVLSSDKQR